MSGTLAMEAHSTSAPWAKAHTIGLVTRRASRYQADWYASSVFEGIMRRAQELGQDLTIFNAHHSDDLDRSLSVYKTRSDGLMLFCYELTAEAQRAIQDENIPLLTIGGPGPGERSTAIVEIDSVQATREATAHLIELGHRRLAHFKGGPSAVTDERALGFRLAHEDASLPIDEDLMTSAGSTPILGADAARELFSRPREEWPTGIVCFNDPAALGVIQVASQRNISIPGDLSLTGVDDIVEARLAKVPLTTIRQPLRLIGEKAVELLVEIMEGRASLDTHVVVPHELVVRGSTAAPHA